MSSQYDDDILAAAEAIADAGATIVFTRKTTVLDEVTGATVPVTTTTPTSAIRVKPYRMDYMRLETGGLTLFDPVTLLAAASGMAFSPLPGDTFSWGANSFTVRTVDPIAPDGNAILYRVIGSR